MVRSMRAIVTEYALLTNETEHVEVDRLRR
jgi:hypothetical protein